MFATGLGPVATSVFTITTVAIAVTTGIKIFNWMATMWKGSIEFRTPMLYTVGFIVLFTIGGISGVMHAMASSDAQQQDTYWIVAHLHYVLVGAAVQGIFSGIYYWFPKMTGRFLSESLGKLNFWLMFIGINLTFFPMHFLGTAGMPRRIPDYPDAFAGWNMISSIGSFIAAASAVLFVYIVIHTRRSGEKAADNPWGEGATTREWTLTSPPPYHTYEELPRIR